MEPQSHSDGHYSQDRKEETILSDEAARQRVASGPRTFGEFLKRKRRELGMNQDELAAKTGINRTYISRIESESGNPTFDVVKRIADGLGISMSEFFASSEERVAQAPQIIVNFAANEHEKKYKSQLLNEGIPIPIVGAWSRSSENGVIADEDVIGYSIHSRKLLGKIANDKLAIFRFTKTEPYGLVIVDLDKRELVDRGVYVIKPPEGSPILAKLFIDCSRGGSPAYVFESIPDSGDTSEIKHFTYTGRQKDFLRVIGRVWSVATRLF